MANSINRVDLIIYILFTIIAIQEFYTYMKKSEEGKEDTALYWLLIVLFILYLISEFLRMQSFIK